MAAKEQPSQQHRVKGSKRTTIKIVPPQEHSAKQPENQRLRSIAHDSQEARRHPSCLLQPSCPRWQLSKKADAWPHEHPWKTPYSPQKTPIPT
eukprot:scaffold92382_cov17-Tisochrysis_lutea.AAC.1